MRPISDAGKRAKYLKVKIPRSPELFTTAKKRFNSPSVMYLRIFGELDTLLELAIWGHLSIDYKGLTRKKNSLLESVLCN
jgi:hypothetical protein